MKAHCLCVLSVGFAGIVAGQGQAVVSVTNYISPKVGLSPGSLATITGSKLGDDVTSVEVGGRRAALINAKTGLLVQIPVELGPGPAALVVNTTAGSSAAFPIHLEEYAPALKFEIPPCYNRAAAGDVLTAVGTGLGRTNPELATGVIPPLRIPTVAKPFVTIAGLQAEVLDSVLANWHIGIYEVKFRVPRGVPQGDQLVTLTMGGKTSNPTPVRVSPMALDYPLEATSAPDAVVATGRCGGRMAESVAAGDPRNPPVMLAGTSVTVKDSKGIERAARVQTASPGQITYLIPSDTALGAAEVTITTSEDVIRGSLKIERIAPMVFCGEDFECGFPVALVMRLRNGIQRLEPVGEVLGPYDPQRCCGNYRLIPIDLGPETDEVYLLLFGTGMRHSTGLANLLVSLTSYNPQTRQYSTTHVPTTYAGPQGEFAGWDQVNVKLPRSLAGSGGLVLDVPIEGKSSIYTYLMFK